MRIPRTSILAWLVAISASAQTPTMVPQGETDYSIFVRGTRVGIERVTVSRTDSGWTVSSTARLEAPLDFTLRRAEFRYDADWKPRSLTVDGAFRARPIELETTFAGTTATSRFTRAADGQDQQKADAVSPDSIPLPNNVFSAYVALAGRLVSASPGATFKVYVAPQAEVVGSLDEVILERFKTATRGFAIRKHKVTFQTPPSPLQVEVWAEEDGRLVRVSIPTSSIDVVRDDVASVAARRQSYQREGDQDVRIPGNGFSIAGTISRPRATTAGPLPAVVLAASPGPLERDGVVSGIPVFGQLASGLADAGFLVVRYDRRGEGQSGGREESATLTDYADDVRAVVTWLTKRKDVDRARIAVVGYAEGGWVGLVAASRDERIARVALVTTPGTTGNELLLEQQQRVLSRTTLSEAEKAQRIELQRRIQAAVVGKGSWDGISDELRAQAETPWFASLLGFDPSTAMTKARQKVLVLQPALDTEMPAHHSERLAALGRGRKKDPGTEVVTVPGVNHLLVSAAPSGADEYAAPGDRQVSPAVVDAIVAFLTRT